MQCDSASLPFTLFCNPRTQSQISAKKIHKWGKRANNFRAIMIAITYIVGSFNTVCPHFLKYESPAR